MNRRPEKNKALLNNFILYITHCSNPEEGIEDPNLTSLMHISPKILYQMVNNYIAEDHVDGYETDEEILINIWLKAEEANREGNIEEANDLKIKFSKLYKNDWIDKEYIDAYLESIGG